MPKPLDPLAIDMLIRGVVRKYGLITELKKGALTRHTSLKAKEALVDAVTQQVGSLWSVVFVVTHGIEKDF